LRKEPVACLEENLPAPLPADLGIGKGIVDAADHVRFGFYHGVEMTSRRAHAEVLITVQIFTPEEGTNMEIRFADCIGIGNLLVLLGIYYKMSVMLYQHKLMWKDFARRKDISPETNGKGAHAD
jgi:hypothetical protein